MVPTWTAYRLRPLGPLHFGATGIGVEGTSEICHADSLFGALCTGLAEVDGPDAPPALLEEFRCGDTPFLLSSAYPYAGGIRFLPLPWLHPHNAAEMDILGTVAAAPAEPAAAAAARKRLKKVRFASWRLFEQWAGAQFPSRAEPILRNGDQARLAPQDLDGISDAGAHRDVRWWWREVLPRVTVDRPTGRSAIYHAGRVRFAEGCGLYFLVWWRREKWRGALERALRALGDSGIGGERSSGYGQFEIEQIEEVDVPSIAGATGFVTLSPYLPRHEELHEDLEAGVLGEGAAWELLPRSGWLSVPGVALRHQPVTMLAEGSALRAPNGSSPAGVFGQLADVTPGPFETHRAYRYGYAFPWPAVLPGAAAAAGHAT